MTWWQKLRKNSLARLGAIILIIFYAVVLMAEFVSPYDAYVPVPSASLLPPTHIYWRNQVTNQWLGPHVYPTTQGPVSLETGEREVFMDFEQPSPIRLFVKGDTYRWLQVKLLLPTQFSFSAPKFEEKELFSGFLGDRHLFGTTGPGKLNLLGTDEQARDQLSRLIYGGRISLSIGLVGIILSFPLGMFIGGLAGYFGGWIDAVLMRLVEVIMTIPDIYLLVALAAVLPATLSSAQRFLLIIVITSFVRWTGLARVVRGQVLSLKSQTFVDASKAMGGRPFYIILRHVLPQTASYVIISATLAIPGFIVAEAILSLIGLGIQQPDPSWGNMLSLATNASILVLHPWLIWPPALLIVLTVLSFNLLGDGLRDALDPRSLRTYD
ncbi:MAG: ABC transporter permease [Leptolyngbya sp. SIO1D8]|nr:ABC transporter permease [Leptolyngbya sp. SIO1D8]